MATQTQPAKIDNNFSSLSTVAPQTAAVTGFADTSSGGTPYVNFASVKSPKFAELSALIPGLKDGDPYYSDANGPVALAPLKYHILRYGQFWVQRDDANRIVSVKTENPNDWKDPHKEEVQAVILVYLKDRIVPSTATFRSVKAQGIVPAIRALSLAADAKWGERSADHKASLGIPQPFARFTATVTVYNDIAKSSGRKMVKAKCEIRPTTIGEAATLNTAVNSPDFQKALATANKSFDYRVEELVKGVK